MPQEGDGPMHFRNQPKNTTIIPIKPWKSLRILRSCFRKKVDGGTCILGTDIPQPV